MSTFNPTDTAKAFAELYRHWSNDARGLTTERTGQTASLTGCDIADILMLWDARTSQWLSGTPVILRLESCDIAVFTMRDSYIALYLGSIETDSPVATFGSTAKAHSAPSWRSMRPCSYAIGRTMIELNFECDQQGKLTSLEACLDDGGSLRISAQGIECIRATGIAALPSDLPAA